MAKKELSRISIVCEALGRVAALFTSFLVACIYNSYGIPTAAFELLQQLLKKRLRRLAIVFVAHLMQVFCFEDLKQLAKFLTSSVLEIEICFVCVGAHELKMQPRVRLQYIVRK